MKKYILIIAVSLMFTLANYAQSTKTLYVGDYLSGGVTITKKADYLSVSLTFRSYSDTADKRLTEIIHTHTERVNSIIENVLQLSRRGTASPEKIE